MAVETVSQLLEIGQAMRPGNCKEVDGVVLREEYQDEALFPERPVRQSRVAVPGRVCITKNGEVYLERV